MTTRSRKVVARGTRPRISIMMTSFRIYSLKVSCDADDASIHQRRYLVVRQAENLA